VITREEIIAEIQKVPEKHLDELYRIVKSYEAAGGGEESNRSVMARLRR
jgi:hypothetical protein